MHVVIGNFAIDLGDLKVLVQAHVLNSIHQSMLGTLFQTGLKLNLWLYNVYVINDRLQVHEVMLDVCRYGGLVTAMCSSDIVNLINTFTLIMSL